jgi:hypothetical protein
MWNPICPLPTLSHGWGNYSESRRSKFVRKDVRSVGRSFKYLGNSLQAQQCLTVRARESAQDFLQKPITSLYQFIPPSFKLFQLSRILKVSATDGI